MAQSRNILAWLRLRERPISAGVALLGFAVAILSLIVAGLQAGLLFSQRATPYRTAVYVRQLEIAGEFAGKAQEQSQRISDLRAYCQQRSSNPDGDALGYQTLLKDYRVGSEALNNAYAATQLSFPPGHYEQARSIRDSNARLFATIVGPATDCRSFIELYDANSGAASSATLSSNTATLITTLRTKLGVEGLSWPSPVAQRRKRVEQRKRSA
jgi:hypothetical protein